MTKIIEEGTRVEIISVLKHDSFYGDKFKGRIGTVDIGNLTFEPGRMAYYGGITLDKTSSDRSRKPWFWGVRVRVIEEKTNE